MPTSETTASVQANLESEPTPSQETKPAKAKPQNSKDKPSIKEKKLTEREKEKLVKANITIREHLLKNQPNLAGFALNAALGTNQETQKQKLNFLVQLNLNEDENDIVEDEAINKFCDFVFPETETTITPKKTNKTKQKGSKAEPTDGQ